MKGKDDNIEMTLNIAGEFLKLNVKFDDQLKVRDAERDVKIYCENLKKSWPEMSDRQILAWASYQFARWYRQLLEIQEKAIDIAKAKCSDIDNHLSGISDESHDVLPG
ncbi:MAG: hypothetical protein J1D77_01025 [Muribaculaceae bacterium]|nr:hypothetical protein [Muribaculaceae bacterium]